MAALDDIKDYIKDRFPDFSIFQEYENKMAEHYQEFMSDLDLQKRLIAEGDIDGLSELKVKYYNLCNKQITETKKIIEKEETNIEKTLEKEIKDASKGFRETLVYDVINLQEVPERFKMVDPAKINDYIARNREVLKEKAKNNEGHLPVPGINFRINRTNVTY